MILHKPYSTFKSADTNNEIQCIILVDQGIQFTGSQVQGNNCVIEYQLDGNPLSVSTQKFFSHALVSGVSVYTFLIRNTAGNVVGSSVVRTNLPFNSIELQPYVWLEQSTAGYHVHFVTFPLNGTVWTLPNATIIPVNGGVRVIFNDASNPITTGTVLPSGMRLEGNCALTSSQGPTIHVMIPFDGDGTTTQGDAE